MNIYYNNIIFYLVFFVIVLEMAKMVNRNLKKSNKLFITELGILLLVSLAIIGFSYGNGIDKLFIIFPILLFIVVIIDFIGANRNIKLLILKTIVALSLIAVGIYFIAMRGLRI